MKKRIIAITLICFFMTGCNKKKEESVNINKTMSKKRNEYIIKKDLSLKRYASFEGDILKEGIVPTEDIAFQIAEVILCSLYGKENIEEQKPFLINLDENIWMIEGNLGDDPMTHGGVAYIEISKTTGEVIKVLHTK